MSEESQTSFESEAKLQSLRSELDEIDRSVLELLRDRLDVCTRVAVVKREHDIPMMQPARVGLVQDRAREFGRAHGVSEDFLAAVFDLLIAEACRVEDIVIDELSPVSETG